MTWRKTIFPAAILMLGVGTAWADGDLGPPVRVQAGEAAIDMNVGHAAPYVHDWDGDGTWDLLVGQLGGGKLRIYRNVGTADAPRFEDFEVFKVGEVEATVPSG